MNTGYKMRGNYLSHANNAISTDSEAYTDELWLFSEDLIDQYPKLALQVLGYSSKFGLGIKGWHYLLDFIWTLQKVSLYPKSLKVLDAGGGNGLLQYILAAEGYAVTSVDAWYRRPYAQLENFIRLHTSGYKESVPTEYRSSRGARQAMENKEKLPRINIRPGELEYHCANMVNMEDIADDEFDMVVSISALEHNSKEDLQPILSELRRVAKPRAPFIFTLSTALDDNIYHEPSHSFLYDDLELRNIYDMDEKVRSNFPEKLKYYEKLKKSDFLKKFLYVAYYEGIRNGMPLGIWAPQYLPFGLFTRNRK